MMIKSDSNPWFAAKRLGYGSALPIAWQGWAVLSIYLITLIVASTKLTKIPRISIIIVATAIFLIVCAIKTAGGWRWRND